jgi:hypothetical protein
VSVQYPQSEGIKSIKLDPDNWTPITGQVEQPSRDNPIADNYAPGGFTGGSLPNNGGGQAGAQQGDFRGASGTAPTTAPWRAVTGAKVNP